VPVVAGKRAAMTGPCIHDLDPASCAVCNGAEKRAAAAERLERGPWFTAQYPGSCPECGGEFGPGDMIRASGEGRWLCGECGEL
jgi:hypothetical protein